MAKQSLASKLQAERDRFAKDFATQQQNNMNTVNRMANAIDAKIKELTQERVDAVSQMAADAAYALADRTKDLNKAFARAWADHKAAITSLKKKHERAIMASKTVVSRLQGELDRLKIRHGVEIADLKTKHAGELASLKKDMTTTYNMKYAAHQTNLRQIEAVSDKRWENSRQLSIMAIVLGLALVAETALLVWVLVR